MILYKTAAGDGCAEYETEKSRFIAYVRPVSSREEAEAFIREIRAKHRDATHNVPAMVLGEKMQIQWASDDGEPQGTSGAPIVRMLVSESVTNVCIVVTRYFGGIKLGTGGLVRAYTKSAKLGLEAAGIRNVCERYFAETEIEYSYYDVFQKMKQDHDFAVEGAEYAEKVTLTLSCESEKKDMLKALIGQITQGSAKIINEYKKNT
ncbi:MAG: YigZ family protein [Clostridia bacterium]|jgi:uncharacterized YigZ family protein|nr:YigZ family protein [Clostridia bacterium]MEE1170062.1 YigZ family protein [Anaerovoracaceae bacterium]